MSIALLIATTILAAHQSTTVSFGGNSAEFTLKLDLTQILFAYACRARHLHYTTSSPDVNFYRVKFEEKNLYTRCFLLSLLIK